MTKLHQLCILVAIAFLVIQCTQYKEITPVKSRQLEPLNIKTYHNPVELKVAWVPYAEHAVVQTRQNEWKIIYDPDHDRQSAMPILIVESANNSDSIWLDLNMDDALLGKLLKHAVMTQEPIKRPFAEYFEVASCARCHPADININMQRSNFRSKQKE